MTIAVDRRLFLAGTLAGGALAALPSGARPAAVCAIHVDQPYVDLSGRAPAYRPAYGMRSAQTVASLDEASFRHAHFYA